MEMKKTEVMVGSPNASGYVRVQAWVTFKDDPNPHVFMCSLDIWEMDTFGMSAYTVYIARRDGTTNLEFTNSDRPLDAMFVYDDHVPLVTVLSEDYFDGKKEEQNTRPTAVEAAKRKRA